MKAILSIVKFRGRASVTESLHPNQKQLLNPSVRVQEKYAEFLLGNPPLKAYTYE